LILLNAPPRLARDRDDHGPATLGPVLQAIFRAYDAIGC
jgi:hypothetical protein